MRFMYKIHFKHGVYTSDFFNSKKECHKAAEKHLASKPDISNYGILGLRYIKRRNRETGKLETLEDWCFYHEYWMKRDIVKLIPKGDLKSVGFKSRSYKGGKRNSSPKRRQAGPS